MDTFLPSLVWPSAPSVRYYPCYLSRRPVFVPPPAERGSVREKQRGGAEDSGLKRQGKRGERDYGDHQRYG